MELVLQNFLLKYSSVSAVALVLLGFPVSIGVVIVTTVIRCRKQQTRILDHEQDIQENIVYYDDEGGGEEDTEAFDMSALRHLNQTKLTRLPNSRTEKHRMIQEFIRDRLQVADQDLTAPPFDSLQTYNFEGLGSAAVSLSSLNSQDSRESEGSYSFLKEWGPRFRKLAELYSHHKGGRWLDLQESDL